MKKFLISTLAGISITAMGVEKNPQTPVPQTIEISTTTQALKSEDLIPQILAQRGQFTVDKDDYYKFNIDKKPSLFKSFCRAYINKKMLLSEIPNKKLHSALKMAANKIIGSTPGFNDVEQNLIIEYHIEKTIDKTSFDDITENDRQLVDEAECLIKSDSIFIEGDEFGPANERKDRVIKNLNDYSKRISREENEDDQASIYAYFDELARQYSRSNKTIRQHLQKGIGLNNFSPKIKSIIANTPKGQFDAVYHNGGWHIILIIEKVKPEIPDIVWKSRAATAINRFRAIEYINQKIKNFEESEEMLIYKNPHQ